MPCRALEAFGRGRGFDSRRARIVLMPCRALEAFGLTIAPTGFGQSVSLNALSGIGGVRTGRGGSSGDRAHLGLNALSGIGGVRTKDGECITVYTLGKPS